MEGILAIRSVLCKIHIIDCKKDVPAQNYIKGYGELSLVAFES